MSDYADFLARKSIVAAPCGFNADETLFPASLKTFQRDIVRWALRRGRAAVFAGTGLGKTLMQLTWAHCVAEHTGGRVLILAPLAVAFQTVEEARKFGIPGVSYAADGASVMTEITTTNYDRLHLFDLDDFAAIVLDESSIIKSHDSKTRSALMGSAADVPYKLCCTATPAPNDWTELGQHAEFLGVMSAKEMLAMFFVHDGAVRAEPGAEEWRLKRHAENDFWRWIASWAVLLRNPNDLGYDEPGYTLPALNLIQRIVKVPYAPSGDTLFPMEARTLQERLSAKRESIDDRVKDASDLVNAHPDRPWLIWCNLNAEADALARAIPGSVNVQGSDKPEAKSRSLLGFCQSNPRVLISKPSIAGWGMNWQHCRDMVFVGLNDSFEQLFQAIRRCWRFGQTDEVNVYMIASELEGAVMANLRAKEDKYDRMISAMVEHMRGFSSAAVRSGRVSVSNYNPTKKMELPSWL